MSQKQYLRVVSFDEQLHYKDKNPIWVKLYCSLLDDYEFAQVSDETKFHAVGLMILATRLNNKLPGDEAWLRQKINASSEINLKILIEIGFLEVVKGSRNKNKNELNSDKSELTDDFAAAKDSFNDGNSNKLNGDDSRADFESSLEQNRTEQNRKEQKRTQHNTTEQTHELTSGAKNVLVGDFKSFSEPKAETETENKIETENKTETAKENNLSKNHSGENNSRSRFTLEECLRYARQSDGVKNPNGLAHHLFQTGNADALSMALLYPIEAQAAEAQHFGAPIKFTDERCRVCYGAKMADPDGRGYRRCAHCKDERGRSTGFEPGGQ